MSIQHSAKTCTKCKETKTTVGFNIDRQKSDGLHSWCKMCHSQSVKLRATKPEFKENRARYVKEYNSKNANKISRQRKEARLANPVAHRTWVFTGKLKQLYGLSVDDYIKIYVSQDCCCAICGGYANRPGDWHVDHCHKTDKVRGILCSLCNLMLGHAKDNKDTLARAIVYLGG